MGVLPKVDKDKIEKYYDDPPDGLEFLKWMCIVLMLIFVMLTIWELVKQG